MDIKPNIAHLFKEKFGYSPASKARAPGRVNLLGGHVNYNDRFILPAAIDRATYIAFSPVGLDQITVWAVDFDQGAIFSKKTLKSKT